MKHRPLSLSFAIVLTSLFSLPCAAQSGEGAIQLGLGTSFFSHTKTDWEYDLDALVGDVDGETSQTSWGFHDPSSTWFEMGYALSDALILGGMLQFGSRKTEIDTDGNLEDDVSAFEFGLYPKIEYMFQSGGTVRPFVGGGLGILMLRDDNNDTETSVDALGLFGRGGLRIFAAPGVSIDPTLSLAWLTGSGDYDAGAVNGDVDATLLDVTLGIGISAWIQ